MYLQAIKGLGGNPVVIPPTEYVVDPVFYTVPKRKSFSKWPPTRVGRMSY